MHQLLLLRHAKSSWDEAKLSDRERPLNTRGKRAARAMGEAMRRLGLQPDLVLVSPARRTQETLARLEPWDEIPLTETVEQLYLGTPEQMLAVLQTVPETVRSVLLIGHNPGMQQLAMHLVGSPASANAYHDAHRIAEAYPTGALAEFGIGGTWARLDHSGNRLVRFLAPRDLPEASN